jgi:hypothetical protein
VARCVIRHLPDTMRRVHDGNRRNAESQTIAC